MRRPLVLLVSLLAAGCNSMLAKGDGRAFGDDLGRFSVAAKLDDSTCGAGAMNAPEDWSFDVVLSKKGQTLYWNTGADAVEGALASDDRNFQFDSDTVLNLDENGAVAAEGSVCTMVRTDSSSGTLDSADTVKAFDGTLVYAFSPEGESDCKSVAAAAGFKTLPCQMSYRMSAQWVSER